MSEPTFRDRMMNVVAFPTDALQLAREADQRIAEPQDPTQLLKPPVWETPSYSPNSRIWRSVFGTYHAYQYPRANKAGWELCDGTHESHVVDSLEAAQSACWQDYCARIKGAFING